MENSEIILCGIKLVLGAAAAFCAILLASKKRTAPVVLLASFVLLSYAQTVYSLLCILGIEILQDVILFGAPILSTLFTALPPICLVLSLIFFIKEKY